MYVKFNGTSNHCQRYYSVRYANNMQVYRTSQQLQNDVRQLTDLPNFRTQTHSLKQLDATPTLQLVVKCWYQTSWTNEN